jgi:hypothetical protein
MEAAEVPFRALCFYSHNRFPYHRPSERPTPFLVDLIEFLDRLELRYEVVPTALADLHALFRQQST